MSGGIVWPAMASADAVSRELESIERAPFIDVRIVDGVPRVAGTTDATFGHRLPLRDGRADDGVFAAWRWDGARLTTETDRYGLYPVYYAASERRISLSTSPFRLLRLGVAPDIDWTAVAVFLSLGYLIGDDTPFAAIKVLPPKGALSWAAGGLAVADGTNVVRPARPTRDQAVEGLIELFRAAIRRRLPPDDNFTVLISGGRDARHNLLELCAQGRPPRFALTGLPFPPFRGSDALYAARVARELGVAHRIVGPGRGWIPALIAADLRTGLGATRRAWKVALADYVAKEVPISFDGIGGDMLTGRSAMDAAMVKAYEDGRLDAVLDRLARPGRFARVTGDARREPAFSAEAARARIKWELERHRAAPNPYVAFNVWNRTRRFNGTSPFGVFRDVPTVFAPFLDHDLFDHLVALPSSLVADGRLHDEALARAYPRYAHIPFDPDRPSLTFSPVTTVRAIASLVRLLTDTRPHRLMNAGTAWRRVARAAAGRGVFARNVPGLVHALMLERIGDGLFAPAPDGGAS